MFTEFILGIRELMGERKDLRKEWNPFAVPETFWAATY